VRFIIEGADELTKKHFGKGLIDRGVEILDPSAGTGTFICELLEHFRGQPAKLTWKYSHELHANVHRLRRSNGGYRWHHARMEPLRDRQGQIIQWYGLSVDIDEGKNAEDQLRRSETYLAEAQALSQTGSAAYNNSTLLYWSEETYRILGFDPPGQRDSPAVARAQA
jgi:PAS domain-containing protein